MRKAQVWSTDVMIGVAIFIGVIALFYASLSLTSSSDYPLLKQEAEIATNRLLKPDSQVNIITPSEEVNVSRLQELSDMDYGTLRDQLGIRGEYCLYLEDENGRIIPVEGKSGIGKPDLNVSGTPCGEIIPTPPPPDG